jgi:hypothetical protein
MEFGLARPESARKMYKMVSRDKANVANAAMPTATPDGLPISA